jgi:hypothetical protein
MADETRMAVAKEGFQNRREYAYAMEWNTTGTYLIDRPARSIRAPQRVFHHHVVGTFVTFRAIEASKDRFF